MQVGFNENSFERMIWSWSILDFSPLSSTAATGPNPQAGPPLQGPGVLRRDPPMDGTWALIERGVTATSSKCPVFKETEGELPLSQMFPMLHKPVIIPATSLSPSVHSEYWFSVPSTAAHTLPMPTLTLSHTHNTPHAVSQMQKRAIERVCLYTAAEDILPVQGLVLIWGSARSLRMLLALQRYQRD